MYNVSNSLYWHDMYDSVVIYEIYRSMSNNIHTLPKVHVLFNSFYSVNYVLVSNI